MQTNQTASKAGPTIAIVPGDRISTSRTEVFDFDDLRTAFAKRYRVAANLSDVELCLTESTLKAAVERLKDICVERDGHDRHVILTQKELQERALKMEAEGIMTAVMNRLKQGRATQKEVDQVVRQQVSMRKLSRNPDALSSTLVRTLKDEKFIFINGFGDRASFDLIKDRNLPTAEYLKFYKFALRLD